MCCQARPLLIHALETGDFGELVDKRLEKHYVESEMFRMIEAAAACVRHSGPKRPRMAQVILINTLPHFFLLQLVQSHASYLHIKLKSICLMGS
jgi:hypothetical protein